MDTWVIEPWGQWLGQAHTLTLAVAKSPGLWTGVVAGGWAQRLVSTVGVVVDPACHRAQVKERWQAVSLSTGGHKDRDLLTLAWM